MAVVIKKVPFKSAFFGKIKEGDSLVSINGNVITDIFDYNFYKTDDENVFEFLTDKGTKNLSVMGDRDCLEFSTYLMDKEHSCKNKCIFCFIDQLPKGLRKSLYFKDDDSRLSFLFGNYITLTNLTEEEVERIGKMHISPINISVHTTNPSLRVEMMKNKNAGEILKYINRFYEMGTRMNCQIVLCKGVNDGENLRKTIEDLSLFFPVLESISVVPAGLTKHREGLYPLEIFSSEECSEVIELIEEYQSVFLEKYGERMVYPSDEFFITAKKEIPENDYYGRYLQLENGVGMVRLFTEEAREEIKKHNKAKIKKGVIATGTLVYPFIKEEIDKLNSAFGTEISVLPVKNRFLGESITVTGLLTGQDIVCDIKEYKGDGPLILVNSMFKSDEDIFLDDMSKKELSRILKRKIIKTREDGASLIKTILK